MARFDLSFFDSGTRIDTPDGNPACTMRDLAHFLDNPFDDKEISEAELAAFTTDHLARMIANNENNELTVRITATQSAFNLIADCMTDNDAPLAIRKARKLAKDNYRENTIPRDVARIEGAFVSAYGADSPVILEALPNGRLIFQECRDDHVESKLDILQQAVTAHQADLVPAIVSLTTALKASWLTIYAPSEASTSSSSTTQDGKKMARDGLQLMLYLNLCKLMEMFPRQPEKMPIYTQQHLLDNPASAEEPEPPVPPTP